MLSKYHVAKLGRGAVRRGGPSLRAAGNLDGYNPSRFGVTAGGGAEIRKSIHGPALYSLGSGWVSKFSAAWRAADYPRPNVNAVELIFGAGF